MIICDQISGGFLKFVPYFDIMSYMKISAKLVNLTIIQVYVPRADSPEEDDY